MLLWSFRNAWAKSVVKVFVYNCLQNSLTRLHSQTAGIHLRKQWPHLLLCLLTPRCKSFIINKKYYIPWPLPLFFILIFSASLAGSDDFVLFDSLDGNGAYSQMFYATLEFCAQVKCANLVGNPATENQSITRAIFLYTGPSSPWSQTEPIKMNKNSCHVLKAMLTQRYLRILLRLLSILFLILHIRV